VVRSFLPFLWQTVRPVLWIFANAIGRQTLLAVGDILANISRSSEGTPPVDIDCKHMKVAAQNLITNLRVLGLKRKRIRNMKLLKRKTNRKMRLTKIYTFS
jgi:hypothetical protein